jgi:hypothetical protein
MTRWSSRLGDPQVTANPYTTPRDSTCLGWSLSRACCLFRRLLAGAPILERGVPKEHATEDFCLSVSPEDQLTDELIGQVCERVRPHRRDGHGEAWATLGANHDQLKTWLQFSITDSVVSTGRAGGWR